MNPVITILLFEAFVFIFAQETEHTSFEQVVLDVKSDESTLWKISDGWFCYFQNTSEIPEDIEYGGVSYIVGFPRGFIRQDFLYSSVGLWMTVHDDLFPDWDVPIPFINFTRTNNEEFNTVEIKCILHENSSIELTFGTSESPIIFTNDANSTKLNWDFFSIQVEPFRGVEIKINTKSQSSFVVIDKVVLSNQEYPFTSTAESETSENTETTQPSTNTVSQSEMTEEISTTWSQISSEITSTDSKTSTTEYYYSSTDTTFETESITTTEVIEETTENMELITDSETTSETVDVTTAIFESTAMSEEMTEAMRTTEESSPQTDSIISQTSTAEITTTTLRYETTKANNAAGRVWNTLLRKELYTFVLLVCIMKIINH